MGHVKRQYNKPLGTRLLVRLRNFVLSPLRNTKRAFLNHQRHDLIKDVRSRHRCVFSICVVRRCDFNNVRRNEINAFEPTNNGPQLSRRPASSFRSPGGRCNCSLHQHSCHTIRQQLVLLLTCRIQGVDVDTQINGLRRAYALLDLSDDAVHSNSVDFACLHDLKTTVTVIFIIAWPGQCRTNTGMDIAVVG